MSSKDKLYARIKDDGNLPTLPEVLLKLLTAFDNEDTPIAEIAEIISADPSLSTKVLQLVNSAYYGFRHSFSSIDQAVVYLGANTIKNLAVTMSVHQFFGKQHGKKAKHLDPTVFWWQSLMCACVAKHIALKTGSTNSDEAYLGGLLHNIGMMTLASTFAEKYEKITTESKTNGDLLELEDQILGVNHCEAGSWVIGQWQLNPLIADAILYHHSPLELVEEAFPLVKVVYGANQLTENLKTFEGTSDACQDLFNLNQDDLNKIVEESEDEVDAMAANLGIHVSPRSKQQPNDEDVETLLLVDQSLYAEDSTAEEKLSSRLRNITLITTFLEQLTEAETVDDMLAAFEKSLRILFNVTNVLFFLPDANNVVLNGRTSSSNQLHDTCRALTLPIQKSSSRIISAYLENSVVGHITRSQKGGNLADQQILSIFKTKGALPFPLIMQKKCIGVIVLGFPTGVDSLPENDSKLLKMLTSQLALSMQIEKERSTKEKELQDERMAAIAMTAKKFAHEINNPLGIISNYLVALKIKHKAEVGLLDDLGIMNEEIKRISSMVSQMQLFAQPPFTQFERINLNSCVSQIVQMAKSSLFTDQSLTLSFLPGSSISSITTSKDAIKQVLINLLKNSSEAMTSGGRVIVRTLNKSETPSDTKDGVNIIISDNGPGLPEKVKTNLYKPFVTTKQGGHSGLGLSIVNKAISDIGGELSCSSTQEEGTTFTITLPLIPPGSTDKSQ